MAQVSVTGTVDRIFFDGKGVSVVEKRSSKGVDFVEAYTCWFTTPPVLREGDTVNVSGLLSKKIDSYLDKEGNSKQKFVLVINNTQLAGATPVAPVDDLPF
jgi:hypothetical protein